VDAAGRAQTGTGKTAAFLISLFARLLRHPAPSGRRHGSPRALILAPTRELTMQIEQEARGIGRYCPLYVMAVFGGVDFDKQRRQLEQRVVDVLVATPGRLLDFRQRHILHLNHVEVLVIDEADRMLDMGFIPDVRRIVGCTPPKASRQTLLFSATLTAPVVKLAAQWTRDPVRVEIEPERVAVATVKQMVYIITAREKFDLLYNLLTRRCGPSTLVFANRRDEARELKGRLWSLGIRCALLSGEVPQEKRIRTLRDFREGRIPVVVATDVAARG
jgi:ATP-dependent RNA helicase RhlB